MKVFAERTKGQVLPLQYYVSKSCDSTLEAQLRQAAVDPNATKLQGVTYFEAAAIDSHNNATGGFSLLTTFLLSGVDPNVRNELDSNTALHIAAKHNNLPCIHLLHDNGAMLDARNKMGQTPLMLALQAGATDAARQLLQAGCDANARDDAGQSCCLYACDKPLMLHSLSGVLNIPSLAKADLLLHNVCRKRGTRFAALYLLEQAQCDVNAADADGKTALHYAMQTGDIDLVKTLMQKGANSALRDQKNGCTPLEMPRVPAACIALVKKIDAAVTNTEKMRLCLPDYSNWAEIDRHQVQHFAVAFFIPNVLMWIGSYLPWYLGFFGVVACAVGFTLVAKFGAGYKKRSLATAGWYAGALCFGSLVLITKVFPIFSAVHPDNFAPLIWYLDTAVMFYCYIRAVLVDPGVVQSTPQGRQEIYDLIFRGGENEIQAQSLDVTSMVKKPLRSKHCTKTGQCVYRFDHYCVWTGNAIGGGNHRPFVLFCVFQFVSQVLVAYTTFSYLFSDYGRFHNKSQEMGWFDAFEEPANRLVLFFLVIYNTFVFLFVSAVLFGQLMFATRNVTSNEVWFADRYKWMFRLGDRAYCYFDQGPLKNVQDFFWTGNLCQELTAVPPMNDFLKEKCQAFAAKARQMQQYQGYQHPYDALQQQQGGRVDPATQPFFAAAQPQQQQQSSEDPSAAFQLQNAIQALPAEKQREMRVVQDMLQQMIRSDSVDGVFAPRDFSDSAREAMEHQAKTMFRHYKQVMSSFPQPAAASSGLGIAQQQPPREGEASYGGDGGVVPQQHAIVDVADRAASTSRKKD